jgi:hypothetical protein
MKRPRAELVADRPPAFDDVVDAMSAGWFDLEVFEPVVGCVSVAVMNVPTVGDRDACLVNNQPMLEHVSVLLG